MRPRLLNILVLGPVLLGAFNARAQISIFGQQQQQSAPGQTDCTDLSQSGAPECQALSNTLQQQQPAAAQGPARENSGSVYSDSGGLTDAQRSGQGVTRPVVFPPDSITDFQRLAKESTGEGLHLFGRDLFQTPPSTFAPADQVPVTPDYVLGPGDELLLRIWGHTNFNGHLTVDRAGAVYLPEVGSVHVAGEHFSDLEQQFRRELSRTYRNFEFSVNLGRLRSIQVFVLGEARRPGTYTISSLSTAFNALLASGGPSVRGSMRDIEVRRAGKTVATVDLYDFVLRGDKSNDAVLQSGDVLFIPPVGAQVAIAGSVRHPAIYEIKTGTTVNDVLKFAGGLGATAADSRLSVDRIENHRDRHSMSVVLDAAGLNTQVEDGDVLYAYPVLRGFENSVTIRGNIANPGRFPWKAGMKLSDIIPDRESLLTRDYWQQRNRLGLPMPLFEPLPGRNAGRPYSSGAAQSPGSRQPLLDGSGNPVYDQNGEPIYTRTLQSGAVVSDSSQQGGAYGSAEAPVAAAASAEGGANEDFYASSPAAQAAAPQEPYGQQVFTGSSLTADGSAAPTTGRVTNGSLAEQQEAASDLLNGRPARRNEIRIPEPQIDWSYAVIERTDPKTLKSSLLPFNLGRLVNDHDSTEDRELQPGDIVTVVSESDIHVSTDQQTKYVRLEGEFASAGVYSVGPNETLADVVRRAGGLTAKAYLFGSSFTRESARVLQQQRLDEYISELTIQTERQSTVRAISSGNSSLQTGQLSEERDLLAQMRRMRATGRVVLEFQPASAGEATIPMLPLENGDTFRVPSRPAIVSVVGSVYGQNVLLYDGSRRVRDYLALAGKPNRVADSKHEFIIRADGSVVSRENNSSLFSSNFENTMVFPGDTIVVPEKPIRPSVLRDIIDYSQVFSQFALGAAAINVIE